MNKEQTKAAATVMQAFAEGKTIQLRRHGTNNKWTIITGNPLWNWDDFDYRVKPEPEVVYLQIPSGHVSLTSSGWCFSNSKQVEGYRKFVESFDED